MQRLHERLKAGRFPNCRKLADELEVSTKTIQRDIDFMRDQLGLPIEYDQLQFGFYYTEPVTSFPSMEVSEGEVIALFIAEKALAQYRGTSFEQPLHSAFQKIAASLQDRITFRWRELDSVVSFRGIGPTVADLDLFETVSSTVLHTRELAFEYRKLQGSGFEARRVQPYHLGCIENQWYLFAFDLARRQLRTFALPRMRRARDTGAAFHRPADFSITHHLGDTFGVFKGTGKHRVVIRFDAFAARLIAERQWHPTQKLKPLPGEELELSMTLGSLEEVERWVLSWGAHATVLEPPALRRRLSSAAQALITRYQRA